jgi:hypothetical protein
LSTEVPEKPPRLVDGELVDDRSVEAVDADRFNHGDFATELAGIVCSTPTPASIALFGPWGAGKSGIANLLRKELPGEKRKVRFVDFDASKYAETPLRRHFISQVAHKLDIKAEKYHEGLYAGREDREVKFRPREWLSLGASFVLAVLFSVLILAAVVSVVALVSKGSFTTNWSRDLKNYLLAAIPVGALISVFVKLAADGFHIRTYRAAPAGDEEFEARFNELVDDAKTDRLVVFIDELDRCSPAQVASVLETLKTFLFVKHCVFIVAADQQVLEQALRKKVRQHTPEDSSNPYYSAGSSYLDKVFQYQLTLPPLRSATLTRFALSLVRERPGIWSQIEDLDEVVSVLIPTHVVSPRRVKVLLNRFAIAYRLALMRAAEGRLDPGVASRATELAKLVCLQAEFPLFADDLTVDARLPEFVRMAAEGEQLPASVRPEVAVLAIAYAEGRRVVAELLVDQPREDEQLRLSRISDDVGPETEAREQLEDGDPESEEGEPAETEPGETSEASAAAGINQTRADEVAWQQAQQLVAYLRKTQLIAGPGPDLLYLESAGAGHGIDAVLADRLQRAAIDNDTDEALRLVTSAAEEDQGRGALLVLADVVRQAQPGIEGRNVVSVLLQSIQRSDVELGADADYIADSVSAQLARAVLRPADWRGALTLAQSSHRTIARDLLEAVLQQPGAAERPDVAVALVEQIHAVPPSLRPNLLAAAQTALLQAPAELGRRLLNLSPTDSRRLLDELVEPVKTVSDAHYAAAAAQQKGESFEESRLLAPPPDEALARAYDAVAEHSEQLSDRQRDVAVSLIRLMLDLDHVEYRNAVAARLGQLAPVADGRLLQYILTAVQRRVLNDWPTWLDALDEGAVRGDNKLKSAIDSVAANLWGKLVADPPPSDEDAANAIKAFARCAAGFAVGAKLANAVQESVAVPYNSDELIAKQEQALAQAAKLINAGLLTQEMVADADLTATAQTLRSDPLPAPASPPGVVPGTPAPAAPTADNVPATILSRVRTAAGSSSVETLEDLIQAAGDGRWLSEAARTDVVLIAASSARSKGSGTEEPFSIEHLHTLVPHLATEREIVDEAFSLALANFIDGPEDAWRLLEPLVDEALPSKTRDALGTFAQHLSGPNRFTLIERALQRVTTHPVDDTFFEAARLSEVPEGRVAERLGELFPQAEDEPGWRGILKVWQQLSPSSEAAQKRLVTEVYVPLIETGDVGLDLALSYFKLVRSIRGVRPQVTAALEKAAHTEDQEQRVDERLLEAQWRRKSLFGRRSDVDEDN